MSTDNAASTVEVISPRTVRVRCRKCGDPIRLEFGDLTRDEAKEAMDKLNHTPMECPGFHVELSGWRYLWSLNEALEAVYGPEKEQSRWASTT
jgi:hypothetical protein